MNRLLLGALAGLCVAGCQERPEYVAPDREARVAEAAARYDPATFDTIAWATPAERRSAGNDVYIVECRRCHGAMGEGETSFAREHGLQVPSLVAPGWPLDGDVEAVRRSVHTGHPAGMPTWGDARLSPREIDAVSYYLVAGLRPEVLGRAADAGGGP